MKRFEQTSRDGEFKLAPTTDASVSTVLLRPDDSQYGRLRPPSRLKINSRCSALTAVLAGQTHLRSGRRRTAVESRYSHVRMEAKRRALDEIATP